MSKRQEKSTILKRAKRYGAVGGKLSGVVAKAATQRLLGIAVDQSTEAKALRAALGGLKGPLLKIAQILGTIPDALPEQYVQELRQLQSNAPSMGWVFVKRRMQGELGPDWQTQFREFGQVAAHAASLGQVHRAITKTGDDVACKLQYPDMQSAVDADLQQLKIILGIYKNIHGGVDTADVYAEVTDRLREELDYTREAKHMALFAHMLRDEAMVHIPKFYPDLSTPRLLTMQWLDGKRVLDFKDAKQSVRDTIARNMFRAWYVPFYHYGVIHGDPHLGNYTLRDDLSVNLLDYGCVRVFPSTFVKGVLDLYLAIRDDKPDLAVAAYQAWGFKNLTKELIAVLNLWARFLYGPILQDKVVDIAEHNAGKAGQVVAQRVHAELKRIGGVRPPREFVFMDRAAVGLGSVFIHLRSKLNWHQMFGELNAQFDAQKLAKAQGAALKTVGL